MKMGATYFFLDANILFSRTLRDWFCLITSHATPGELALRVSEDVLAETLYHLRKSYPHFDDAQVGGVRSRIIATIGTEGIVTGYAVRAAHLDCLTDPHDAHVLAAAEACGANYLVSTDRGFAAAADLFEFEIYDADSMLCLLGERNPAAVQRALKAQVKYFEKKKQVRPEAPVRSLHEALESVNAPRFAAHIREQLRRLAMSGSY